MTSLFNEILWPGKGPSTALESTTFKDYQRFMQQELANVSANVDAYMNKRARPRDFYASGSDSGLKMVLKGATFVPAHPTRWKPGLDLRQVTHFVVHRPGLYPPACTLTNIVREFSQENRNASTHFIIGLNGELIQMVDLADIAFHAGKSPGLGTHGNKISVGVEIEGAIGERFSVEAYTTLAKLLSILANKTQIHLNNASRVVVGHSEVRPGKKLDPGPNFDYEFALRLARATPAESGNPFTDSPLDITAVLAGIVTSSQSPESFGAQALHGQMTNDAMAIVRTLQMGLQSRSGYTQYTAEEHQRTVARDHKKLADQLRLQQALVNSGSNFVAIPIPNVGFDFAVDEVLNRAEPEDEG
jgi:hypothetical protein